MKPWRPPIEYSHMRELLGHRLHGIGIILEKVKKLHVFEREELIQTQKQLRDYLSVTHGHKRLDTKERMGLVSEMKQLQKSVKEDRLTKHARRRYQRRVELIQDMLTLDQMLKGKKIVSRLEIENPHKKAAKLQNPITKQKVILK